MTHCDTTSRDLTAVAQPEHQAGTLAVELVTDARWHLREIGVAEEQVRLNVQDHAHHPRAGS